MEYSCHFCPLLHFSNAFFTSSTFRRVKVYDIWCIMEMGGFVSSIYEYKREFYRCILLCLCVCTLFPHYCNSPNSIDRVVWKENFVEIVPSYMELIYYLLTILPCELLAVSVHLLLNILIYSNIMGYSIA